MYHELAISLANQWIPQLHASVLNASWAKNYPWAAKIIAPTAEQPSTTDKIIPPTAEQPPSPSDLHDNPSSDNPPPAKITFSSQKLGNIIKLAFDGSGDESDGGDHLQLDGEGNTSNTGESTDGLEIGFKYDDEYMS
jgi:hypothetical protein